MIPYGLRELEPDGRFLPALTHIAANGDSTLEHRPGMATQCWAHYPSCKDWPAPCAHSHVSCCGTLTTDPLGLCPIHRAEILP